MIFPDPARMSIRALDRAIEAAEHNYRFAATAKASGHLARPEMWAEWLDDLRAERSARDGEGIRDLPWS